MNIERLYNTKDICEKNACADAKSRDIPDDTISP